MAQATDVSLADQPGASYRAEHNDINLALASLSSGTAAPATMYPNMLWVDTTLSLLKKRSNANSAWVTLGPMDGVPYDEMPVNSQSAGYTAVAADRGKLIDFTAAATLALTAAATLGAGWFCAVRDSHASGSVTIDPAGAETIDGAATVVLTAGQSCFVVCDGAAFKTVGRDTTPAASDTLAGVIEYAVQSEMETATSNVLAVTPGRVNFHPGIAKAWASWNGTGTVAIRVSRNVSSITDNGTGDYTVNFTTAFSGIDYAGVVSCGRGVTAPGARTVGAPSGATPTVSAYRLQTADTSGTLTDMEFVSAAFFGDQ